LQSSGHGSGDFILCCEDVGDLAIVGLRPELEPIVNLGERHADPHATAFFSHASSLALLSCKSRDVNNPVSSVASR
jgi:hypothetical protein